MTIEYTAESSPEQNETDSAHNDIVVSATYLYDLEFNSKDALIGGEWYKNAHPDFVWTAASGVHARSSVDDVVGESDWDPSTPLPQFWRDLALKAAVYNREPVGRIVEALLSDAKASEAR